MAVKRYEINGRVFQYEEGAQPPGAVEVKPVAAKTKPGNPKRRPVSRRRK